MLVCVWDLGFKVQGVGCSFHFCIAYYPFLDGYSSTVQSLLDWFEVDLGFTELLFIQIDLCVMCVCASPTIVTRYDSGRCKNFAEYSLFYRALLQKRPMILRSLLIVATYDRNTCIAAISSAKLCVVSVCLWDL